MGRFIFKISVQTEQQENQLSSPTVPPKITWPTLWIAKMSLNPISPKSNTYRISKYISTTVTGRYGQNILPPG